MPAFTPGELHHFLRDWGFLLEAPFSWRKLHARVKKLQGVGVTSVAVAQRLRVDERRWEKIVQACSVVVALWDAPFIATLKPQRIK